MQQTKAEEAQADVRELAGVLKDCEWVGSWEGEWECPSCYNGPGRTHAQNCALALALARPGVVALNLAPEPAGDAHPGPSATG